MTHLYLLLQLLIGFFIKFLTWLIEPALTPDGLLHSITWEGICWKQCGKKRKAYSIYHPSITATAELLQKQKPDSHKCTNVRLWASFTMDWVFISKNFNKLLSSKAKWRCNLLLSEVFGNSGVLCTLVRRLLALCKRPWSFLELLLNKTRNKSKPSKHSFS